MVLAMVHLYQSHKSWCVTLSFPGYQPCPNFIKFPSPNPRSWQGCSWRDRLKIKAQWPNVYGNATFIITLLAEGGCGCISSYVLYSYTTFPCMACMAVTIRYLRLMNQILGQNGRHGPVATARHDKTHLGVEEGGLGCCLGKALQSHHCVCVCQNLVPQESTFIQTLWIHVSSEEVFRVEG